MRQTILGSGSALADELARVLCEYTDTIRLVSRSPKAVLGDEELVSADLLKPEEVDRAIEGSDVVYLIVGLVYDAKYWLEKWPEVMQNVIQGCRKHKAKLVFLDNVYMYGKVDGVMDENTPYNPCSIKGEARAQTAKILEDAFSKGEVDAIIARSADFYGYGADKTFAMPMIFDKLRSGGSAMWLVNADVIHSMTYVPDIAKAMAILGNDDTAYNQIWHLPTDKEPITGKQFIEMVAEVYGVKAKYTVVPKWMLKIIGLFSPMIKETNEMLYQFELPYLFESSKFENRYFKATPYKEAIKQIKKREDEA